MVTNKPYSMLYGQWPFIPQAICIAAFYSHAGIVFSLCIDIVHAIFENAAYTSEGAILLRQIVRVTGATATTESYVLGLCVRYKYEIYIALQKSQSGVIST